MPLRKRALVIEDDAVLSALMAEMLELMGYAVCSICTTQSESVSGYFAHRPDFMVVDDRLREGRGVHAVEEILAREYVPHLYVAGDPDYVISRQPQATVIRKPCTAHQLDRAIRSVMGAVPG